MKPIFTVACLAALLAAVPARAADGPPPSLDAPDLARGAYGTMHMRLQKTILRINVADIDVRFDRATQARLAQVAAGQGYSAARADQAANIAIAAPRAVVEMLFVRDVPLKRWMGVVRDNLEQARAAGLITPDVEKKVSDGLPVWFSSLKDRGYLKGDRLLYSVTPDALRTAVISAAGQVLLDWVEPDSGARRVVLASYFAPGSELREPLLRSLFSAQP